MGVEALDLDVLSESSEPFAESLDQSAGPMFSSYATDGAAAHSLVIESRKTYQGLGSR